MANARFAGRVAVVTAGASGIGAATARLLHAEGANVVVGDVNQDGLQQLENELGDRIVCVLCDVTNEDDVEQLIGTAVERFGRLDAGFNVAGGGTGGPLHQLDGAGWRDTIDLTLNSVFYSIKHEARQLISQGEGGTIASVASMCAQMPMRGGGPYCSGKAAVEMLTKVAALELGEYGIRVNAVSPGRIATAATVRADSVLGDVYAQQAPLGRIGEAEEIAEALLFLSSDQARFATGTCMLVDGGFTTTTHFDTRPYREQLAALRNPPA